MATKRLKAVGGKRGPRNWVVSQKRFIERAVKKLDGLAARVTDAKLVERAKSSAEGLRLLDKLIDSLPKDFRPQGRKNSLKIGDEVFMQTSLREKYGKMLSPKSVVEPMKVEQIDGRRVRLRLAGGETLILPVNALARTAPK